MKKLKAPSGSQLCSLLDTKNDAISSDGDAHWSGGAVTTLNRHGAKGGK